MQKKSINLLYLYPKDMNIYGDYGNILTIIKRLQWRDIDCKVIEYNQGDVFPSDIDIVIGGGGQDSGQSKIVDDLAAIGAKLIRLADSGVPMLMICGLYQLFGHKFTTLNGQELKGIGLLDIETFGKNERLIGNIVTESNEFGMIIGYENHSGQTFLGKSAKPLATVIKGAGNNTADNFEGARYNNVIGSYLHGSLLPKNPAIADFLILKALQNKYPDFRELNEIDNELALLARKQAAKRPR